MTTGFADSSAVVKGRGLRAYDAVQLGSAMMARDLVTDLSHFLAFDVELNDAAAAEGFATLP